MKLTTYLLLGLVLFMSSKSMAQIAVTAPALEAMTMKNNASAMKQLTEAAKQSATLQESASLLKQSVDIYNKVNEKLTAIGNVKQVMQDQIELVREAGKAIEYGKKIGAKSPEMLQNYIKQIDHVIQANRKNVELLKNVLTGGLKLSDSERLKSINDVSENTANNMATIHALNTHFENYTTLKRIFFNH